MKSNVVKKVLMVVLTASLVIAPAMTAGATTTGTTNGTTNGSESSSSSSSSSSKGSSSSTVAAPKTSAVKLSDGTVVKTTVAGSYSAKSVEGIAVTTPLSQVNAALGLKAGENAYVSVADSNYGPKAQQCVKDAAAAYGAEVSAVLDIFMGKIADGKFTSIAQTQKLIEFKVSAPKGVALKAGYEWAVICVAPDGTVKLLPNWSNSGGLVQFYTDSFGVFAIAQIPAGSADNRKVAQYNQAN